jgi:hypothetical protein
MNANEAISKIRFMLDVGGSDGFTSSDKEALHMAINALSAEITAQPKSNADRIRQMTDEELAKMVSMEVCRIVKPDGKGCPKGFYFGKCDKCVLKWLKQEADKDAGTD